MGCESGATQLSSIELPLDDLNNIELILIFILIVNINVNVFNSILFTCIISCDKFNANMWHRPNEPFWEIMGF